MQFVVWQAQVALAELAVAITSTTKNRAETRLEEVVQDLASKAAQNELRMD